MLWKRASESFMVRDETSRHRCHSRAARLCALDSFKNVYYSQSAYMAERGRSQTGDYYNSMSPFIARMMNTSFTTPDDIARTVLRVVRTSRPALRVPATWDAVIFYYLRRFIPRFLFHHILFWMLPKSGVWAKSYTRREHDRPSPKASTFRLEDGVVNNDLASIVGRLCDPIQIQGLAFLKELNPALEISDHIFFQVFLQRSSSVVQSLQNGRVVQILDVVNIFDPKAAEKHDGDHVINWVPTLIAVKLGLFAPLPALFRDHLNVLPLVTRNGLSQMPAIASSRMSPFIMGRGLKRLIVFSKN